jgi:hypothetical protein
MMSPDARGITGFYCSSSIETAIQLKKKIGPAAPLPEKEVRKDGMGHWPQFSEKKRTLQKTRM